MKRETLTEALFRFTQIHETVQAPRPGSNLLPILCVESDDGSLDVGGEELEALYRAGMMAARPEVNVRQVADSDEYGGIDADHVWFVTPAGRQALADREGKDHG